jgi:hypothetical protein
MEDFQRQLRGEGGSVGEEYPDAINEGEAEHEEAKSEAPVVGSIDIAEVIGLERRNAENSSSSDVFSRQPIRS